ncbi:MAG TPA: hypothetical protein PKO05_07050, partial [Thermoanaerobaculia bacterium]|nr:hypothetical protein [Thermoanaerobaculia bacterium]
SSSPATPPARRLAILPIVLPIGLIGAAESWKTLGPGLDGSPLATVLALLPALRKAELAAIAIDPRLAEAVRQRARLLSGLAARERGAVDPRQGRG